jgi:small-conductance mechanosensitive channel
MTLVTSPAILPGGQVQSRETLNGETLALPDQVDTLGRELFVWLRHDSLAAVAGIALGLTVWLVFRLVRAWARRRIARSDSVMGWGAIALRAVARTRGFFILAVSLLLAAAIIGAPPGWTALVRFLFTIAAAIQGAIWAREVLVALVQRRASAQTGDGSMSSAVGVITVLINVAVWSIAAIILLDNLGVNVTALIAGLGIGGIAIGLAAQGVFSDLFAALSILLDQPFRRGDTIQVGGPQGVIGTVEHIGLKSTRLRALSGEIVVMSNANLLNQQINNFAQFARRRVVMQIGVIYQTRPDLLRRIPDAVRAIVDARPLCRYDRMHLTGFGAFSIDFELVFIVDSPELPVMFGEREAVSIGMVELFEKLGVEFAYPTQVEMIAGPDGQVIDPREQAPPVARSRRRTGAEHASLAPAGDDGQGKAQS